MLAEDDFASGRRVLQDIGQGPGRVDGGDPAALALLDGGPGDLTPALCFLVLTVAELDDGAFAEDGNHGLDAPLRGLFDDIVHGFVLEDRLDERHAEPDVRRPLALQEAEPRRGRSDGLDLRADAGPLLIEEPDDIARPNPRGAKMMVSGPGQPGGRPRRPGGRDEEQVGGQRPS